jgi:hypothetical protein
MAINHEQLMAILRREVPDIDSHIDQYGSGLLHCEVGAFLRMTEQAMDQGRLWEAERHFRLVERILGEAGPEVRNALEISYLEELALGECTPARRQAVKERMPVALRRIMVSHSDVWA